MDLYRQIMVVARNLGLDEAVFPDFLHVLDTQVTEDILLGQYDLPKSTGLLLAESQLELRELEETFGLGELLTEKLVERKIRLTRKCRDWSIWSITGITVLEGNADIISSYSGQSNLNSDVYFGPFSRLASEI